VISEDLFHKGKSLSFLEVNDIGESFERKEERERLQTINYELK
jgi:hypothetical protein